MSRRFAWLLPVMVIACGRTEVDPFGAGGGGGGGYGETPDGDDRGVRPGADEDGDGDGGGDGSDGSSQTCQNIDFLFVVDNSGSMGDNQANLAANYGVILDGVRESVASVESMHLGVITTDAYEHNLPTCRDLGGLVSNTGGLISSGQYCGPFVSGESYMTEDDDLDVAFPCAARVGIEGSGDERPLLAAMAALTQPMTNEGACNEGFVRDDGLLVLVIVTDEDAETDPTQAALTIIETKPNLFADVVAVALVNTTDDYCNLQDGEGSSEEAPRLESFVAQFPYGLVGPICTEYYDEIFDDVVTTIAQACSA